MKRISFCLNGEWDFMPLYGQTQCHELPPTLVYEPEKVRVPSSWRGCSPTNYSIPEYQYAPMDVFEYPEAWREADAGVLHRTFFVPPEMIGHRIFLQFDAVSQQAYIYLNGKCIAHDLEAFLPFEIDITDIVNMKGENDLCVLCSTFDYYNCEEKPNALTGLNGSWYCDFGRGLWQDVFLTARSPIYLDDVEIVTSVKKHTIALYAELCNTLPHAVSATVTFRIADGNSIVRELIVTTEIPGSESLTVCKSEIWNDPILWDTENPHLYTLTTVLQTENALQDTRTERFGFREFTADGSRFLLNGTPINLRGDSWHFMGAGQQTKEYAINWYRICQENGLNSVRLHAQPHPSYYLDAADEMGILIIDETAIYGSGKSMYAGSPAYLQNCRDHIKRLIRRDKNHASVVIWSQQNEMRWVPGRDIFKQHEYELMEIFHAHDRSHRLVSLDGDNRLLPAEQTEIASLHYNIDGTINQWTRKTPLTIGEHGGMWYICPQNSSMYMGLDAYLHNELCMRGISIKEQLFMEYARRREVTGISSFNFAHYYANSMPKEDVTLPEEDLTTPGVKPKKIKKFSLTLNNGKLNGYPDYSPNDAYYYSREGMRPVTVIAREYNSSFYDDHAIARGFDIYNDTLHAHRCRLEITVNDGVLEIYRTAFSFYQQPAEHIIRCFCFMPPTVMRKTTLSLTCTLFHEDRLVSTLTKNYSVYPSSLRTAPVTEKSVAFYGGDNDFAIFSALAPCCTRIYDISTLTNEYDVLVAGSNLTDREEDLQPALSAFLSGGGNIILLEQFSFSLGSMTLQKTDFLRAQASEYSHPILSGLCDDDFTFWNEKIVEEGPIPFIHGAFEKPVVGDYTMLLECSYGDFGDGGDLWSPLLIYDNAGSTVIANQLEIMSHFATVPQAAVLLRNMLSYAANAPVKNRKMAGALLGNDANAHTLLENIAVDYREISIDEISDVSMLIVAASALASAPEQISAYAATGKKVLILPTDATYTDALSSVLREKVEIQARPVYQLCADYAHTETKNISIVDMYGLDLVMMTPREVENRILAQNTISVAHAVPLLHSVENTIWEDLFVKGYNGEYCKRSLCGIHAVNPKTPQTYMIKKGVGRGSIVVSQFLCDANYDKSIRFYTRLLSNMGFTFHDNAMNMVKDERQNALPMIMSLPYRNYWGYERAMEYFSDPEYSLNNLGEGLYGWMKKLERSPKDGYLRARESANQDMFMTCFVHCLKNPANPKPQPESEPYRLHLEINCPYELYINGQKINSGEETVTLQRGINRFFLLAHGGAEDVCFRPVFYRTDGSYATNLKTRLTVDEIDPK